MSKLVEVGGSCSMVGDRPAALIRVNTAGEIAAFGRRRVGWISWSRQPRITRRLQPAGHTGRRPMSEGLRWSDGFCLRLWGGRCLIVAWPVRRQP